MSFSWSSSGGGADQIGLYATFADFPTLQTNGTFAYTEDTNILYVYTGSTWLTIGGGAGGGVNAIGALNGGTPSANGASISGTILYLQSAGTDAGLVDTNTQTFLGAKTFSTSVSSPLVYGTTF